MNPVNPFIFLCGVHLLYMYSLLFLLEYLTCILSNRLGCLFVILFCLLYCWEVRWGTLDMDFEALFYFLRSVIMHFTWFFAHTFYKLFLILKVWTGSVIYMLPVYDSGPFGGTQARGCCRLSMRPANRPALIPSDTNNKRMHYAVIKKTLST